MIADQMEAKDAQNRFRAAIVKELRKPAPDMEWVRQLLSADACATVRLEAQIAADAPPPESPSEEDGDDDSPEDVIGRSRVEARVAA